MTLWYIVYCFSIIKEKYKYLYIHIIEISYCKFSITYFIYKTCLNKNIQYFISNTYLILSKESQLVCKMLNILQPLFLS